MFDVRIEISVYDQIWYYWYWQIQMQNWSDRTPGGLSGSLILSDDDGWGMSNKPGVKLRDGRWTLFLENWAYLLLNLTNGPDQMQWGGTGIPMSSLVYPTHIGWWCNHPGHCMSDKQTNVHHTYVHHGCKLQPSTSLWWNSSFLPLSFVMWHDIHDEFCFVIVEILVWQNDHFHWQKCFIRDQSFPNIDIVMQYNSKFWNFFPETFAILQFLYYN